MATLGSLCSLGRACAGCNAAGDLVQISTALSKLWLALWPDGHWCILGREVTRNTQWITFWQERAIVLTFLPGGA